jgi:DNA polymerase-3 subunit beta
MAVQELLRNLKEDGCVSFWVGQYQLLFDINGVLIATRLIEGEFPNYNQVIPNPTDNKVRINTGELLSSIRRASLLATPDFQAIKFEVFRDKMVVSKTTPDVGESREELPVQYKGSELAIGFNPNLLIDFLKNVDAEQIEMELFGADKSAVMRLQDYLYLALPMRI